eukprot:jgi/Bigna1/136009/aug1.32_g10717
MSQAACRRLVHSRWMRNLRRCHLRTEFSTSLFGRIQLHGIRTLSLLTTNRSHNLLTALSLAKSTNSPTPFCSDDTATVPDTEEEKQSQTRELNFASQLKYIDQKIDNRYRLYKNENRNRDIPDPEGGWTTGGVHDAVATMIDKGEVLMAVDYVSKYYSNMNDGPSLRVETYNNLLAALVEKDNSELVVQILEEMITERNIEPDVQTYNCILEMYGRQNISEMVQTAKDMNAAKIAPNRETFHTLIRHLSKLSDITPCMNIVQNMFRQEIAPNHCTYKVLMDSFIMQGRYEEAKQVLSQAICKGESADDEDASIADFSASSVDVLGSALRIYAHMHDTESLQKVFDALVVDDGLAEIDSGEMDAYFYALLQANDMTSFLSALDTCSRKGVFPSYAVIQCGANRMSANRDDPGFSSLMKSMERASVVPGMVLLNQMLQTHTTCNNLEAAMKVFRMVRERRLRVDLNALQAMLRCLCRSPDKIDDIWEVIGQLEEVNLPFTISTFSTVVRSLWEYSRGASAAATAAASPLAVRSSSASSAKTERKGRERHEGRERIKALMAYTLQRWPGVLPRLGEAVAKDLAIILWRWRLLDETEEFFRRYPPWTRDLLAKLTLEIAHSKPVSTRGGGEDLKEERENWHRMIRVLMAQEEAVGPFGYMSLLSAVISDHGFDDEETIDLLADLTQTQIDKDPDGVSGEMGRMYLGYALEEPLLRLRIIPPSSSSSSSSADEDPAAAAATAQNGQRQRQHTQQQLQPGVQSVTAMCCFPSRCYLEYRS